LFISGGFIEKDISVKRALGSLANGGLALMLAGGKLWISPVISFSILIHE
jgi:hypothetical protein